jgi:hypothetical protein
MSAEYHSFRDFYPFYLSEHSDRACRRMHFIGSTLGLLCVAAAIGARSGWLVLLGFALGYGFAFAGHYLFEKNRPATFRNPFYSFVGDCAMYRDILLGRIPF